MKLGINPRELCKGQAGEPERDIKTVMSACRAAGFEQFDYMADLTRENWQCEAKELRLWLDGEGLAVHQSHMPFFRYTGGGTEKFSQAVPAAVEAASLLGSRYLVVHADEVTPRGEHYCLSDMLQLQLEYLAPLVERAKKAGLCVAVENLFEDGFGNVVDGRSRFCSRTEEILAVIEAFDDPAVGCCWDFGHARVSYKDEQPEELQKIGAHLMCTHLHDNYGYDDTHLPPFIGTADWEAIMRVLENINYDGVLSLEYVYGRLPDAMLADFLDFSAKIGNTLISMAGK